MIDVKVKSIGTCQPLEVSGKSPAFAEQNFLARSESLFSYSHPKCKPLAKRLQTGKPKPSIYALRSRGEGQVALAGLINNARSNLDPFKLALVKTELEGRVDGWLLSRV